MRRKKSKTQAQHIKSAWSATALLTLQNVYNVVTAPTFKPNIYEDAQNTNKFEDMSIGTLPCIPPRKEIPSGQCIICKEEEKADPTSLQCGHSFCCECITEWLSRYDGRCPECRAPATQMTDKDGVTMPAPTRQPDASRQICVRYMVLGQVVMSACAVLMMMMMLSFVHSLHYNQHLVGPKTQRQ